MSIPWRRRVAFYRGQSLPPRGPMVPFDGGLDCHRRIWYQANYKVNVKGWAIVRDLNPVNLLLNSCP
jgi:hypothetical protein